MKFDCYVNNIQVLSKRVIEGKKVNDNGSKNVYYMIGVRSENDEIGEVGCTLDVFDHVIKDKCYDFHFIYETRFDKNFIKFDSYSEATLKK